jgi:hypothetical protein
MDLAQAGGIGGRTTARDEAERLTASEQRTEMEISGVR